MENPIAVANFFIQKSFDTGKELTSMKLVKLVYIAHGWYLGLYGQPLLNEPTEAWKYGPVINSVYKEFKAFGNSQITRLGTIMDGLRMVTPFVSEDKKDFLNKIWDVYKDYNGLQLSTLTHQMNTPWNDIWNKQGGKNVSSAIIPNDLIQQHYKSKVAKQQVAL